MPVPNMSTMGGHAPGRPRAFPSAFHDIISRIPSMYPGEGISADGRLALEETSVLGRSPGCFAVSVRGDRKAINIGEAWTGLGETADEGGLEGCSARRPGLVLSDHGDVCIVGGSVEKTTAALVSEAGSDGITIVLACIPKAYSTETDIIFRGWHVASTIDTAIGKWENVRRRLSEAVQEDYEVIPIALLDIDTDGGDYLVDDVFWNLEAPVVTLPRSLRHPWRTHMKYNGKFDVEGGRVDDGTEVHVVTGLTDIDPATSTKVWLSVKYYNNEDTYDEIELQHGVAWPTNDYLLDTNLDDPMGWPADPSSSSSPVSSGSAPPAPEPPFGWSLTNIRVAEVTSKHEVLQYLYEDQFLRKGGTYRYWTVADFRWKDGVLQALFTQEIRINGVTQPLPGAVVPHRVVVLNLFDTGPCNVESDSTP